MSASRSAPVRTYDFFYGWDLLYKTIARVVNKKSDLLIALAHFLLTKHYSFRCVGIGDDKTMPEEDSGSELLPENWNENETKYSLRYIHDKQLYLLLGQISEDALVLNMLDVSTKKVSNICIEPDNLVVATTGDIKKLMPKASEIADRYRRELFEPVFSGSTREVTTQTSVRQPERSDEPLFFGDPRRPGSYSPSGFEPRPFGFPNVGGSDLDPLGRGGSGNLFPFPSQPSIQGSDDPRFDPFAPPDPNIRPDPNPDHMRPPGWGGNYYT